MITGQNGILNQATKAKEETEKASIEEKVSMAWSAVKSTEYINSNQNIDKSSYYLENLKKELACTDLYGFIKAIWLIGYIY